MARCCMHAKIRRAAAKGSWGSRCKLCVCVCMQVSEVCIHHKKPERIAAVYVCVCKLVKCVCITKNPNRIASLLPLYPSMCGNSGEGTAAEKAQLPCAAVPWPMCTNRCMACSWRRRSTRMLQGAPAKCSRRRNCSVQPM